MESYETAYKVLKNVFVFLIYCILIILLTFCAKRAYKFGYEIFADETSGDVYEREYPVTITESMTDVQVAELLETRGLIEDKNRFLVKKAVFFGKEEFLPGNYILKTSMTMSQILQTLVSGNVSEDLEEET